MNWSPLSGTGWGWWTPTRVSWISGVEVRPPPAEVLMVGRWRDKDAFREYLKSRDHRVSHDWTDPLLRPAVKLDRLESMHTYEVVAE